MTQFKRYPDEEPMTEEQARGRKAQARHALERLEILEGQGYENVVHRSDETTAELRKRYLAHKSGR